MKKPFFSSCRNPIMMLTAAFFVACGTGSRGPINGWHGPTYSEAVAEAAAEEPADPSNERYAEIAQNRFVNVANQPVSTFSVDVDNAAYANVRRLLNDGMMPPKDAVRIEEMINYFEYEYELPEGDAPMRLHTELGKCPWNPDHQILQIGLKGKAFDPRKVTGNNLVFLLDVSGSMSDPDKLPLLKNSIRLMVNNMPEDDRIAIVAYAGAAGLVLPSTPVSEKSDILKSLDKLKAGGSTAGGQGIKLAYKVASEHFIEGGNNRVVLATDGDFNVGASSDQELEELIVAHRDQGIFLTICGFGRGNYNDAGMERISNKGNGNFFYIDNIREAEKVFVKDMYANMFTIAKDVKLQVEFNPLNVQSYRLIGYENRVMDNEDFDNDKKDAGEIGAGHTVTAFYEIVPGNAASNEAVKRYQTSTPNEALEHELANIKLRFKAPDADESQLNTITVLNQMAKKNSIGFMQGTTVAAFGMKLQGQDYAHNLSYGQLADMVHEMNHDDEFGYLAELEQLIRTAGLLDNRSN